MNKVIKINSEINGLYNKQFEIRYELTNITSVWSADKVSSSFKNDKMPSAMVKLEELENILMNKKLLREEMQQQLIEIENQATDKWKFKVFILRWFGRDSYRKISRKTPFSYGTVKRLVEEIAIEIEKIETCNNL
jgi:hypothetical protein